MIKMRMAMVMIITAVDGNESDNSNDDNGMFNRIMIIAIKNKYSFHITVASRNIAELVDSRRYAN